MIIKPSKMMSTYDRHVNIFIIIYLWDRRKIIRIKLQRLKKVLVGNDRISRTKVLFLIT